MQAAKAASDLVLMSIYTSGLCAVFCTSAIASMQGSVVGFRISRSELTASSDASGLLIKGGVSLSGESGFSDDASSQA